MNLKNFEFKARVDDIDRYENKLLYLNPEFQGIDHQIDTYFSTSIGRLKLREGNIEHALIHYERGDTAGAKVSDIILYQHQPDPGLKNILIRQLGIKVVVDKKRKIYFIDNVKFHFDTVDKLGTFIEVEAIDQDGSMSTAQLLEQCNYYLQYFNISQHQLIDKSYSDLLL
ncbi:MAG: class IV adenylate cyclase [Saprospiraceae bacterium]